MFFRVADAYATIASSVTISSACNTSITPLLSSPLHSLAARRGRADASGKVTFSGLDQSTNYSYRVTVKSGAAEYASNPFQFRENVGHRVLLHSYPVTREIKGSMIGMRGFVYIEPRDDVFQFEVLFRVFNVGRVTWVPSGSTFMRLPEGYKAFKANESMADTRFEAAFVHARSGLAARQVQRDELVP